MDWLWVLPIIFAAAMLGGVVGFGTGVIALSVLALTIGAAEAIPVLAIAMIFANGSRAVLSWKEIDWKAFLAYGIPGAVSSILGASLFLRIDELWLTGLVGVIVLIMVPLRRYMSHLEVTTKLVHLPFVGLVKGFVSGVSGASGPIATPFLISYGLVKGAYVATEGLGALIGHLTRGTTYYLGGAMPVDVVWLGLGLGVMMIGGTFAGKKVLDKLDTKQFIVVAEVALVVAGVFLVGSAVWQS